MCGDHGNDDHELRRTDFGNDDAAGLRVQGEREAGRHAIHPSSVPGPDQAVLIEARRLDDDEGARATRTRQRTKREPGT